MFSASSSELKLQFRSICTYYIIYRSARLRYTVLYYPYTVAGCNKIMITHVGMCVYYTIIDIVELRRAAAAATTTVAAGVVCKTIIITTGTLRRYTSTRGRRRACVRELITQVGTSYTCDERDFRANVMFRWPFEIGRAINYLSRVNRLRGVYKLRTRASVKIKSIAF